MTGDFYGQPIKTGALHKKMGVSPNKKLSLGALEVRKNRLMAIKNKNPKQLRDLKEVVFAINAKTKFHHKGTVVNKKAIK